MNNTLLMESNRPSDEPINYNSFFFRRDIIDKYIKKINNVHLSNKIQSPLNDYNIYNIDDIMIITSPERMGDVVSLLGSGAEFDLSFTYGEI